MEGVGLRPALNGRLLERAAIYWKHEGNPAVRVDDWKLVRLRGKGPWELYNLESDRTLLDDFREPQSYHTFGVFSFYKTRFADAHSH